MIRFLEKFILSEEPAYKWSRHLIFWICVLISNILIYGSSRLTASQEIVHAVYIHTAFESLMFMSTHIFLTYSIIYFLFPRFLFKGKYVQLVVGAIVVVLLTVLLSQFVAQYPVAYYREMNHLTPMKYHNYFVVGILGGFRGGLTFGGFAVAIKLVKYWYFKKQEVQQLQLEKTQIELKSLKDQLHPHFLFNTLNNLYAMTLPLEGKSSEVVMRLSDLLQYMLYECKADFVSLDKELQFIKHYIELEKLRFGDNLDLRLNIKGQTANHQIAPLIILPLIENAFKHGVSETIEQPWLSIDIHVLDNTIRCRVLNSKFPYSAKRGNIEGIGLKNLKQRLSLIYPDSHKIEIFDEEEMFIVQLNFQLKSQLISKQIASSPFKSIST